MHRTDFSHRLLMLVAAALLATSALLAPHVAAAANNAPPDATAAADPFSDREAMDACIYATEPAQGAAVDATTIDARVRRPDLRVQEQDLSGQDLTGRNFRRKVLVNVKLKGAKLHGADFTEAIICASNLEGADMTGARLDRALIGGDAKLHGANFSKASARGLKIANASGSIRIDGADLRGAFLFCEDKPRCIGVGIRFSSMTGADLRGATATHLCCKSLGLATARLDGVTTQLDGRDEMDFIALASAIGRNGSMTFFPAYGFFGGHARFDGAQMRRLAVVLAQMKATSARPSFDCARAATAVEKAVCADPALAALDRALGWLWARVEQTADEKAQQRQWLENRSSCPAHDPQWFDRGFWPDAFKSTLDPRGCIGFSYAQRIKVLAPKASVRPPESATYTTDAPLALPPGDDSRLAEKFFLARGFWMNEIEVTAFRAGAGKLSGSAIGENYHGCGFAGTEAETKRVGAQLQIFAETTLPRSDEESMSVVITPDIILRVDGQRQFQCGARASWSDVYFRQPAQLIAKVKAAKPAQ